MGLKILLASRLETDWWLPIFLISTGGSQCFFGVGMMIYISIANFFNHTDDEILAENIGMKGKSFLIGEHSGECTLTKKFKTFNSEASDILDE